MLGNQNDRENRINRNSRQKSKLDLQNLTFLGDLGVVNSEDVEHVGFEVPLPTKLPASRQLVMEDVMV